MPTSTEGKVLNPSIQGAIVDIMTQEPLMIVVLVFKDRISVVLITNRFVLGLSS